MGWVLMSERDLNRLEVLAQIDDGHLSVGSGANMLGLTRRQVFRLLKRYRENGAPAHTAPVTSRMAVGMTAGIRSLPAARRNAQPARAEDALATRVHRSSYRNRLSVR
jgi:hypothetical protein